MIASAFERGESYAGCDGAHCCGVVDCLFVLVRLIDSRIWRLMMMLEDGWMDGMFGWRKKEERKSRKAAGTEYQTIFLLVTPRNASACDTRLSRDWESTNKDGALINVEKNVRKRHGSWKTTGSCFSHGQSWYAVSGTTTWEGVPVFQRLKNNIAAADVDAGS